MDDDRWHVALDLTAACGIKGNANSMAELFGGYGLTFSCFAFSSAPMLISHSHGWTEENILKL